MRYFWCRTIRFFSLKEAPTITGSSYFKTIALVLIYWFIIFWIQRASFIFFFSDSFKNHSLLEIAATFTHGFRLDLSAVCYLTVLPFLALAIQQLIHVNFYRLFLTIYTFMLLPVVSFISVFDMGIYHDWHIHVNYRAINYLRFVTDAAAFSDPKVNTVLTFIMLFQIASGVALFLVLFRRANYSYPWTRKSAVPGAVLHAAAFPLLFLGMRGGAQLIPLNESDAFFSKSKTLNDTAVNATWNLVKKYTDNRESLHRNPYHFMSEAKADSLLKSTYTSAGDSIVSVLATERPNIVLVILESFTADVIESLGGDSGVTPNLDTVIQNGILFSRIYASGHRTDQGMASIFSGWPATPDFSVMTQPEKYRGLNFLPESLNKAGYHSSFFYGGELEFANMKAYLVQSGITDLHDKDEFSRDQMSAKWGAHDEFVFDKQVKEAASLQQPFFSVILTLSSHEPFMVPIPPKFPGVDIPSKLKSCCYYTDRCIGDYLRKAKTQPWYRNTLFIFVADHGHVCDRGRIIEEPPRFHIPLIFFGEVLQPQFKGKKMEQIGMQTDLPATILSQLHLPASSFTWSNDLLNNFRNDFAYYTFDTGFGWMTNESSFYFYFEKKTASAKGNPADSLLMLHRGQAFVQKLYGDYIGF